MSIRTAATQRLLQTMLERPPGTLANEAPIGWHHAAVIIQRHTRGYQTRTMGIKRGGTMFKSHFAYMTMRDMTVTEYLGLTAFVMVHQILFVVLFTELGYGDEAYRAAQPLGPAATALGFVGLVLFITLNLFDAHLWSDRYASLKFAIVVLASVLLLAGAIMLAGVYPQAPFGVYLLAVPTAYYALRQRVFDDVNMHSYFAAIAYPSVIGGFSMLAGWLAWVFAGNVWDGALQRYYYTRMLCDPDATACLPAAILYFAPMGGGMLNLACGLMCYLLAISCRPKERSRKTLHVMVRLLGGAMLLICAALYVQAAVSGANSQLANTVLIFSLLGLILTAILVGNTVGWEMLQQRFLNIPLIKKIAESLLSDWAKAAMFFGGWLPFVVFLASSALKQQVRIYFWLPRGATDWADERTGMQINRAHLLTTSANGCLEYVRKWRWTSVFSKVMMIGIFFMVMNVGFGKMTNVFISWLIQTLLEANTTVGVVCGVFIVTGVVLFMIPPVPGFAVYLCGSFLLPQFLPFWEGVIVSSLISFGLKLLALMIQQKLIGELMGNKIAVRSFIGVNSLTMRSIRKILEQPGLGLPKVCILVGGPDWPTSVTTGILKLPLLQMMLGTSPVLIVVTAVTMAGAFQLRKNEGGVWSSTSDMMLGVASGVMFGSLIASAYYIEETAEKHREELEALPRDEAVDAEDRKKEAANRVFNGATRWRATDPPMPWWMKLNLIVGATLQIVTCYLAQFFATRCFAPFEMTDRISDKLDGDWTNIFRPLGRVVILLWAIGCANYIVFRLWARVRVAELKNRGDSPVGTPAGHMEKGAPLPQAREAHTADAKHKSGTNGAVGAWARPA